MTVFSEWLDELMTERGLGERQLAEKANVTHSTIRLWRAGITTPTWDNCAKLASALRVRPAAIRRMAGYLAEDEELGKAAERLLTPEEEILLRGWRQGRPEARRILLAAAELAIEIHTETTAGGESAAEDRPTPQG